MFISLWKSSLWQLTTKIWRIFIHIVPVQVNQRALCACSPLLVPLLVFTRVKTPLCFHRPTHPTETTLGVLFIIFSTYCNLFIAILCIMHIYHTYLFCSVSLLRWGGCSLEWWSSGNTENEQNSETLNHHNNESWTRRHWIDKCYVLISEN